MTIKPMMSCKIKETTFLKSIVLFASILLSINSVEVALAKEKVPQNKIKTDTSSFTLTVSPLGNPQAPQGGTLQLSFSAEPQTLNPISSSDFYSQRVMSYVLDGLLNWNIDTNQIEPGLAEKYDVSPNQLTYTFYLRKNAVFQDGQPITAEDVKFTFDCIKDPAFKAAHRIPYYENIGSVIIVDPHTVKIVMNKVYYNNIVTLGSGGFTPILPKHIYSDPSKPHNKDIIGSGPYKLEAYNKGKNIILVKNPKWWGWGTEQFKGSYNFEKISFRFIKEENLALEMLKKEQIDTLSLTPEAFMKKTSEAPFGQTILKKKVENSDPGTGYSFVGWNFLNPIFKDKNTRFALALLMNREEMNNKFRYNLSQMAQGPWLISSVFASNKISPIKFDPEKAKKILSQSGWKDQNKDGVLEKTIQGKKTDFKFTLMFANRDVEKYYTLYQEDLKKAGISMELKLVEWNTFIKALADKKFDAATLGWSGGDIESDPKQIWHSESARAGGSNFISYSNPKVDQLIDKARVEMDPKKRAPIWQEIDRLIAEDYPYVFMFNEKYKLYAHHKKIGMPKDTYKYEIGTSYWWMIK